MLHDDTTQPRPLAAQMQELENHLPDILHAAQDSLEDMRLADACTDLRDASRLFAQRGDLNAAERMLLAVGLLECIEHEIRQIKFKIAEERKKVTP